MSRLVRSTLVLATVAGIAACGDHTDPVGVPAPTAHLQPRASVAPATDSVAYTLSWTSSGSTHSVEVHPIRRNMSVVQYYHYNTPYAASANTPDHLTEAKTFQAFLYEDTGTGDVSLVFLVDKPNDGNNAQLHLSLTGLPTDAAWVVQDDPGDQFAPVASDGSTSVAWATWACCSDGGALSGSFGTPFQTSFSIPSETGIDYYRWRSFENGSITTVGIPSVDVNSLVLTAAYPNTPPVAVATAPDTVELNGSPTTDVALDGTASSDADGNTLTYTWSENGSQVATGASPTLSGVGLGAHTYTLVVSDGLASDTAQVTVHVVDPSPPTVEATLTGTSGSNGWYTSDVDVSWTVTDPESPASIVDGCAAATAGGGTHTYSCTAQSAGGSTTKDVTVRVDSQDPTLTFSGNQGSYDLTDTVDITCTATDDGSGIDTADCPEAHGPAYTFGIGSHTLNASATDLAGNQATDSTTFEVRGDAAAVEDLLRSWIGNPGLANALAAKLRAAESATARGNDRAAQGAIRAFYNQVRALTGKWLTQEQAQFLLGLYS